MFRLAHISDVHLHTMPQLRATQLLNKRITGYLNWKFNRKREISGNYLESLMGHMHAAGADHTVVSGDLVNLALPDEIENARRFLESLGPPEDVTAIMGNHDSYVPGAMALAIRKWRPYLSGDERALASADDYPVLRIRGDVALIGCNSARATLPFFATGFFREDQKERLCRLLDKTRGMFRIVSIHHPPVEGAARWHKRLVGQELFREAIETSGAELVLHGHTHLTTIHALASVRGEVPVICVPAAGNGHGNNRPAGRYNIYSITKSGSHWSLDMEAFACSQDHGTAERVDTASFELALA